jgi:hypothetical protein
MILRTESGKCPRGCCNHSVGQLAVVAWGPPRVPAKQKCEDLVFTVLRLDRKDVKWSSSFTLVASPFTLRSLAFDLSIGWIIVAESISDARE